MRKPTIPMSASAIAIALILLGGGCRKEEAPLQPSASAPTVSAPASPASAADPLADDLDTAIEELRLIDAP